MPKKLFLNPLAFMCCWIIRMIQCKGSELCISSKWFAAIDRQLSESKPRELCEKYSGSIKCSQISIHWDIIIWFSSEMIEILGPTCLKWSNSEHLCLRFWGHVLPPCALESRFGKLWSAPNFYRFWAELMEQIDTKIYHGREKFSFGGGFSLPAQ